MIRKASELRSRNYASLMSEAYDLAGDFVEVMHPLLGIEERGVPTINFGDIDELGTANAQNNEFLLSNDYLLGHDGEDFKFTIAHETAHCLDPRLITGISNPVEDLERDETFGNLGALVYFAKTEGRSYAEEHARVRTKNKEGLPLTGHSASRLFLSGRTMKELEQILKQMSKSKGLEYADLRAA